MSSDTNLLNVVSIGGGTGLACLLKGLKHHVLEPPLLEAPTHKPWIGRLTAVVTVTDDGGSSGRLRDELRVLPPGDIRNCLVALSTDESLMSDLFQYRFPGYGGGLKGHSFGNLFLSALTAVTGDFLKSIRLTSEVLAIRGRIFPSTVQDVELVATLENGVRLRGESSIGRSNLPIRKIALSPPRCKPVPAVIHDIECADLITIGPGSLFTSILPNLLVRGIAEAIARSKALKVYIGNLMTQPGETAGYSASRHLEAIRFHARNVPLDAVILNNQPMPARELRRYRKEGAEPVQQDLDRIEQMGLRVFECGILSSHKAIRHDPARLAGAVYSVYREWQASQARPSGSGERG